MSWLLSLFSALFSLWRKSKDDEALNVGVNYQKAQESGDAIKNAADAQVVDAGVERMSDDSVRKSPYANQRD